MSATTGSPETRREREIRALGERIFALAGERAPSLLEPRGAAARLLEGAIADPGFRTALFRFVDVFPALRGPDAVARHLREYFAETGEAPALFGLGVRASGLGGGLGARAAAALARRSLEGMARRFIAGRDAAEALPAVEALWRDGIAASLDLLGEATLSRSEADAMAARYAALLEALAARARDWPERPGLEDSPDGPLPRVNVSVKLSALHWQLEPAAFDATVETLAERLLPLFEQARRLGAHLHLDVEDYESKDLCYAALFRVLRESSLADYPHVGIVCQAYLRDARADAEALLAFARAHDRPLTVRLVKGAYWDIEQVRAAQRGHPPPVFDHKAQSDASFESLARFLLQGRPHLRPAFGSHNVRSLAAAVVAARELGVPDGGFELQVLHGMAAPIRDALRELGLRVREYVPVGELLPGMAYLVRRLLENTSNHSFLRASFVEHTDRATLLAPPPALSALGRAPRPARAPSDPDAPGPFRNEPPRDFTRRDEREAFAAAVAEADARVNAGGGEPLGLFVRGREIEGVALHTATDPAAPGRRVARIALAGPDQADAALAAAAAAFPAWRDAPARERAGVLFRAAAELRARRDALAALEIFEVGKPWREADADVCEAIDFLEYYGREVLRLGQPRTLGNVPGEHNEYGYQARGIAVVIGPWNFPLAIPTGMSAAALGAGNCVVLKPAEASAAIARELVRALDAAGAPPGSIAYLPGPGASVGARLVRAPETALVAFTGSLEVGLEIVETAAHTGAGQGSIKRVIAELGGKNAIVVDDDADLDAAVAGVVQSAFGYAGQKCSACSRVIVLAAAHDAFLRRLVEATASLRIGPPADPASQVPPLVNAAQQAAVRHWQERAAAEHRVALRCEVPERGCYAGPMIVTEVSPDAPLAQQEVFGPLLAVLRARDFDEALAIANRSAFALTGGLYSRSPAHIARARREFRVGNLYLNRPITGALVERQPFGGFRLSGVGSKAGGPDYLLQFLEPRVVTENTTRRGFTPEL